MAFSMYCDWMSRFSNCFSKRSISCEIWSKTNKTFLFGSLVSYETKFFKPEAEVCKRYDVVSFSLFLKGYEIVKAFTMTPLIFNWCSEGWLLA